MAMVLDAFLSMYEIIKREAERNLDSSLEGIKNTIKTIHAKGIKRLGDSMFHKKSQERQ